MILGAVVSGGICLQWTLFQLPICTRLVTFCVPAHFPSPMALSPLNLLYSIYVSKSIILSSNCLRILTKLFINQMHLYSKRTEIILCTLKCCMYIYAQKCNNACIHFIHLYVNPTHSNIDRPWIVLRSSIHHSANSKLFQRLLTLCQLVFTTIVLQIEYLSSHDRRSVIEQTLNSSCQPTVPATKRWRLCVLVAKRWQLNGGD